MELTEEEKQYKQEYIKIMTEYAPEPHNTLFKPYILSEYARGDWFINNNVPKGKVVDLCGNTGFWGSYFQKIKKIDFDYTLVDKVDYCINFGPEYFRRLNLKEPTFIKHDIRKLLPFKDEEFDQAWLFGWWSAMDKNCEKLFSEIRRILKFDGLFIFDMFMPNTLSKDQKFEIQMDKKELAIVLNRVGFSSISMSENFEEKVPHYKPGLFYGVICRKKG